MRVLNGIEAMTVAGGRAVDSDKVLLDEVIVRGRREPGVFDASVFVVGAGNSEAWSGTTVGERGGGGGEDPDAGGEEIIDVKLPKPDFCVDGLFLSKTADAATLNDNWKKAFQYMSAQQLNELANTLFAMQSLTYPTYGTGGWQLNLPTGAPQELLKNMEKELREAAKLKPEDRWAYGGNFGDLLSNGMKEYTYIPWRNMRPQLAMIFGKACSRGA